MAPGEPTIRDARAGDAPALAALFCALGFPNDAAQVAARLDLLAGAGNRLLVAQRAGRVVGAIGTARMVTPHRPAPVGRISVLVVEEGLRGQGIGRALVRGAERALAQGGCTLMEVTSRFELEPAHRFYEGLGYTKTSVRLARQL